MRLQLDRPILILLASSAAAPLLAAGVPTFDSSTELVNLTVSVVDSGNHYVPDLDRADFEIFEDGVPQDVLLFSRGATPLTVTLLVDGSTSMSLKLPFVRAAARDLIAALRPADEAEIVQFADRPVVLQELTNDHGALAAAVDRVVANGRTALYDALYVSIKQAARDAAAREGPSRHAIVVLTDGEDTASLGTDDQVLELARRSEINVYPIQIADAHPELDPEGRAGRTRFFMTSVAEATGGEAYFPPSPGSLKNVYARIAQELRTQYNLGYVPRRDGNDRRWRRVTVVPLNHAGLLVRHRPGYFPRPQRTAAAAGTR